jgi:hypothetical protein
MARKTSAADMELLLQALREHLHRSLFASVAELICALQERHLPEARRIAGQLTRDLRLCDSLQAQYFISRIVSLLADENVFDQCDQLSAWLLFLEREIECLAEVALADRIDPAPDAQGLHVEVASAEPNLEHDAVLSVRSSRIGKESI